MQPLSIQGFSLNKETLLNLLRKVGKKKLLAPCLLSMPKPRCPVLKLNKHSTLCSAHFSQLWCQFSWKDLVWRQKKMDNQGEILSLMDLCYSPYLNWCFIYTRSYFIMQQCLLH